MRLRTFAPQGQAFSPQLWQLLNQRFQEFQENGTAAQSSLTLDCFGLAHHDFNNILQACKQPSHTHQVAHGINGQQEGPSLKTSQARTMTEPWAVLQAGHHALFTISCTIFEAARPFSVSSHQWRIFSYLCVDLWFERSCNIFSKSWILGSGDLAVISASPSSVLLLNFWAKSSKLLG